MRLIDADALKEEVNKKKVVGCFNTLLLIDNAPTVSVHDVIANTRYLQDFCAYRYKNIPNKYEMHIDTNCLMLRCPKCQSGIIATAFSYAVGTEGYAFCPYCGEDLRTNKEASHEDHD